MIEDIYRNLQERLDNYSVGFPATDSGVEIKILKALFSPEDAEMFLGMTPKLEKVETIAQRMEKTVQSTTAEQMMTMAQNRGLI